MKPPLHVRSSLLPLSTTLRSTSMTRSKLSCSWVRTISTLGKLSHMHRCSIMQDHQKPKKFISPISNSASTSSTSKAKLILESFFMSPPTTTWWTKTSKNTFNKKALSLRKLSRCFHLIRSLNEISKCTCRIARPSLAWNHFLFLTRTFSEDTVWSGF